MRGGVRSSLSRPAVTRTTSSKSRRQGGFSGLSDSRPLTSGNAGLCGVVQFYYRGQAELDNARGIDKRASRVKIAKRFTRLALACVAGDQPMRHPCFQKPDSILDKLRRFHQEHGTPLDVLLADLEAAVEQLPYNTCNHEAEIVADVLELQKRRRRLLPGLPGYRYNRHRR